MVETIFFWSYLLKKTNTTRKSFAPQNVPHIVKLSFSGVLMHFLQKLTKKLLFELYKVISQKEAKNNSENNIFPMSSKMGKS